MSFCIDIFESIAGVVAAAAFYWCVHISVAMTDNACSRGIDEFIAIQFSTTDFQYMH